MGCESSKSVDMVFSGTNKTSGSKQKSGTGMTKANSELTDDEMQKKIYQYIQLDKDILAWEGKNIPKSLQATKERANEVANSMKELEQQYQAACDKMIKEKADVDKMQNPSVKVFFKNQHEYEEKLTKEQEEYLEAISAQEVLKKQLEGIQMQARNCDAEVQEMSKEMSKLALLYDEQDQILDDIFSGAYGSGLENRLESEVEELLDRKERIGVAKYKWSNGRLLLQHAYNQLGYAVSRWQTMDQVPSSSIQVKYQLATETRNNLIAASQNIMNAKRYLNNIKFPYCEPEEIATLNKACSNIYVDMLSPDRHQHALQCFCVTHRRASALLQWFDNVINQTIEKDLARAKAELIQRQAELRKERLRLMNEKIGGNASNMKISDKDVLDEFDDDSLEPELLAISEPDRVEGENVGLQPGSNGQVMAPTPLPLSELAPPPSQEDLFGNIEQLKEQHQQERAQIERIQEANRARMEQGLQEKLRQRRNQRTRMMEE
ncbi:unnamed protein product [Candidula unifasciata]|uniref:Uncharacterized protein n=1 Tax=Candidula unifasciata TaxID=100452 RepID=A0A8S3ZSZ3_9EUPU|nr:unnamed protein product [Candidula unifasciata]